MYQNYSFSLQNVQNGKKYMRCSNKVQYLPSGNKTKIIMYKDYSFRLQNKVNGTKYMQCSNRGSTTCKARLTVDESDRVIKTFGEHNHPAPNFYVTSPDNSIFMVEVSRGKSVVMYRNYTYSFVGLGRKYLCCSKKKRSKCTARMKVDRNGVIVFADTNHNHPPPNYHRTSDGRFFKI
ncbi:uncharacterized protein [Epargyreus clarus]|uniref:uncharacterized protein n=1 Tax=Epargyreus clarus TaxID=520877 RepID=UPI003C2F2823